MSGDIQLGKVLNLDGTTKIITIYNTGSDRKLTKKMRYVQKPITRQSDGSWNPANLSSTGIDLLQVERAYSIKGWLYPTDEDTSTTLNGAHNSSVTTITVTSAASFDSTGYIRVENEVIKYTGKDATNFTGCTRGALGTDAASHATLVNVYQYDDTPGIIESMTKDGGKIKIGNNNQTTIANMKYNDNDVYIAIETLVIGEPPSDGDLIFEVKTLEVKIVEKDLGDA